MISDKEFLEIIQGLYDKTSKENLAWQKKTSPEDCFYIALPQAVIELQYGRPSAEPDFIAFTLMRSMGGTVLATRNVYEGGEGWDPLLNLYALIKRREQGWDHVFKNVREFLGQATTPVGP